MNANGSVTLRGVARKMIRHVELILTKPSHGSVDSEKFFRHSVGARPPESRR